MNLNYPNLDYPFGPSNELFPEAAAIERRREAARRPVHHAEHLSVGGDWHYFGAPRRPWLTWSAVAFSAAFHATLLGGLNHRPHAKPAPVSTAIEVTLMEMPEKLKDLEEEPSDPGDRPPETAAGVEAPTLPDIPPAVVLDTAFIQQIDISSLQPKNNLDGAKVTTIPTLVRHGGQGGTGGIGKVFDLSSLDRPPTAVFQAMPQVPMNLRNHNTTVKLVVQFIVTSKGEVVDPRVLDSENPDFDEIAMKGVMKWRFRPGIKSGRAVNTRIQQPMTFTFTE